MGKFPFVRLFNALFVSHLALFSCLYNVVCHMLICMTGRGDGRAKVIHVLAGLLSFPVVPTFPEAVITYQICKDNLVQINCAPHWNSGGSRVLQNHDASQWSRWQHWQFTCTYSSFNSIEEQLPCSLKNAWIRVGKVLATQKASELLLLKPGSFPFSIIKDTEGGRETIGKIGKTHSLI